MPVAIVRSLVHRTRLTAANGAGMMIDFLLAQNFVPARGNFGRRRGGAFFGCCAPRTATVLHDPSSRESGLADFTSYFCRSE